jgi:tetratricopeptide (TPR) repeat protein
MLKRLIPLVLMFAAAPAAPVFARDKAENWVEVRSPHFVVVTNASDKQGHRVADQFERMRSVFHAAFPKLNIDPGSPIIVLVIKDEKDFRALEPVAYLAKGSLQLGGLFLRAPDKNYVLMRLDAEGEHPYSVVYHEYTHLLVGKSAEWMPLWMNEGLAEFYQNTEIHEKDASLGEPSTENILLLRQRPLLPLTTLFTVDEKSPYYHEENKGSIFYAESWALIHYLQVKDRHDKTLHLDEYSELLIKKVDPVGAATQAFGDLKKLQAALEAYVRQGSFTYFRMATTTEVDDSAFQAKALTAAQADAVRADFLAYNDRTADARALLDHVLQEDPNNVSAQETLGFMEFHQGHLEEARERYAKAVQSDSQNFLAHYYFAAISMNDPAAAADEAQIESSLRSSIKLNPSFAPSYDRLAAFLGMRRRNLDEARLIALTAVSLDPANIQYRVNVANVLMAMGNTKSSIDVLRAAEKLARTPQESQTVDRLLTNVEAYAAAQERFAVPNRLTADEMKAGAHPADVDDDDSDEDGPEGAAASGPPPLVHRKEFVPSGPHRFVVGVLKDVHCEPPNLDLNVSSGAKMLALHTENYYKLQFSALGFQPTADLKPCSDLENRPAKVEYVESADKSEAPHLIAIELHK